MGMDVYVGPLSRYRSGDWLTLVQQVGVAAGHQVQVLRTDGGHSVPRDEALASVRTWQGELLEALGLGGEPWREDPDLPYWTDKPDWDGYGGLLLLAAYAERPDLAPGRGGGFLRRGRTDDPRDLASSPAFVEATKEPRRFPSLLRGAEWWLPLERSRRYFRASTPDGTMLPMGPLTGLLMELRDLGEAIGLDDRDERAAIRQGGPPEPGADVQTCGRFGLSVFLPMAGQAYLEKQPLVLDY